MKCTFQVEQIVSGISFIGESILFDKIMTILQMRLGSRALNLIYLGDFGRLNWRIVYYREFEIENELKIHFDSIEIFRQ